MTINTSEDTTWISHVISSSLIALIKKNDLYLPGRFSTKNYRMIRNKRSE